MSISATSAKPAQPAKPAQAAKPAKSAKPPEPEEAAEPTEAPPAPAKSLLGGRRKLLLLAVPVVLATAGAGLWFGGILKPLLGMGQHRAPVGDAHESGTPEQQAKAGPPASIELPEIVANLNVGTRRNSYIKLHARLELAKAEDDAALKAAMPRLLDLFQTYLREMRPEELQGSEGTYRLREELIARANIALAPIRVTDVLFTEMLIQ